MTAARSVVRPVVELPPHAPRAELDLLGHVMATPRLAEAIPARLRAEHFFSDAHAQIFTSVLIVREAGLDPTQDAVIADLQRRRRREAARAVSDVLKMAEGSAHPRTIEQAAELIVARYVDRRASFVAAELGARRRTLPDAIRALQALEAETVDDARPTVSVVEGVALAEPLPPLEHLVREIGLVAGPGAPHLVAGYGFAGKTLALQAMLLALAAGISVWGGFTGRARRVIHVDCEQGLRLTARRYQRLAASAGVDLAELGDALGVVVMPSFKLTAEHADRWREIMRGRDLLVLDSLRAATAGSDENASEIRAGLDLLGALSEETGCRVCVIHHARKPTADENDPRYAIRGSSAIFDACDAVYVFTAAKGEPVLVTQVKARSQGEPCEDFALVVSDVDVDGNPRGGLRVAVHGAELVREKRAAAEADARASKVRRDAETVRAVLASAPGLGTRELRDRTAFGGSRLAAAIAELGDGVDVREERDGRSLRLRHYLRGTP